MRNSIHGFILLALMSQPVAASQTICTFSGETAQDYYELEFIGYSQTNPTIVFSSTSSGSGNRMTLTPADYTLKQFSQKTRSVDLTFRNPKDHALPLSFRLDGTGGTARLAIGSRVIHGVLACGH